MKLPKKMGLLVYTILIIVIVLAPFPIAKFFEMSPTIITGCMNNEVSYGWPAIVYTVIKECVFCCDSTKQYPYGKLEYVGIIVDLIYYLLLVFMVFKIIKIIRKSKATH